MKLAGPAKLMHAYAQALQSRGHEVFVVSGGGAYVPTLVQDGFVHTELPDLQVQARRPVSILATVRQVRRIIVREKIDVINSFNAHSGWIAAFADPLNRRRHFNTVLGTGREGANRLLPGRILAVSGSVRERLEAAGVQPAKVSIVYNATLAPAFFAELPKRSAADGSGEEPVRFVGIAMFTGQKGHERILPLFAELYRGRGRNVRLTLVGDGATRAACEAKAAELGISERVTFAGALSDVVPALNAADIFIHLPEFETFGIVLAEAMARGLPVVSLSLGGIPEVVDNGNTGLLVSRDDEGALLEATDRLVTDPVLRRNLGRQGHARSLALFSLERLGETLDGLYHA